MYIPKNNNYLRRNEKAYDLKYRKGLKWKEINTILENV